MNPSNVLLLSGGIDSATLLWDLKPDVKCLVFNYGQRHIKEMDAALNLAGQANCFAEVVHLENINRFIAAGSQAGTEPVPLGHYTDESMKATVVPNRNMIMIAIAVGHAIKIGAKKVHYAAHAGDHAIYPDCRPEFVDTLGEAIVIGNQWSPVNLHAPFIDWTKDKIVRYGFGLKVPYELTWSCYQGRQYHCGKCGTCVERMEAFRLANMPDPTTYEHEAANAD